MKKISITKIGIQEGGEVSTFNTIGETKYGYIDSEPQVGRRFVVWNSDRQQLYNAWSTSIVTELIDSNTFNTLYSRYNWQYETN